jgi:signal transduction histidine kinase
MTRRVPEWWPDLALGVVVAAFGVWEVNTRTPWFDGSPVECYLVVLGMAVAAGLFRRSPEAALALVWLSCAFQVLAGLDVMLVQLAVTVVSFGCARYGRTAVVWLSGLSIPAAAVIGITYVTLRGADILDSLGGVGRIAADSYSVRPTLVLGVSALVPLVIPWLIGLMLRISEQARTSREAQHTAEEARSQAEEIAHLREEQARMARDVHDVVGHSLAVILAQAESAQFIKDTDTQALKKTMENIATSARSSLQDVRQVLTTATERQPSGATGGLGSLIEGVRSGGYEVVSSEVGKPQPLPPELEVVAFRVLQEMLTNAIKYGRRGEPVSVERHWEGELRIEVRNIIGTAPEGDHQQGQGLNGMRRRLESVGGHLDVRRREEAVGATFTTTAWVPLRAAPS